MSNFNDDLKRHYRLCLHSMSERTRFEVECEVLYEAKQRVIQAQMQFDRLGGQSRIDHLEYLISEMEEFNE